MISRWVETFRSSLFVRPPGTFAALDGLRGFASVIVLVFHCALFSGIFTEEAVRSGRLAGVRAVINGFWSGIDIFFVLSGFLIGRILISSLRSGGTLRYRRFMLRRVFRIFPAYYLILTLALFVIAPLTLEITAFPLLFMTNDLDFLRAYAWTNYLYVNNYVNPGNEAGIMSWGWSLCVEEHFYFLLPPLLWLLFRIRSDALRLSLLVVIAAIPVAIRAVTFAANPSLRLLDGFYYYSHNRFDEIFVGVIIAYVFVLRRDWLVAAVGRLGAWTGALGLACWAVVWTQGGLYASGWFAVVAQFFVMALGTGLLVLVGLFRDDWLARFFSHSAWYPLSRISYGTYLVHPFVLFGLLSARLSLKPEVPIDTVDFLLLATGTFVGASLVAALLFVAWERPFLQRGIELAGKETEGDQRLPPARGRIN